MRSSPRAGGLALRGARARGRGLAAPGARKGARGPERGKEGLVTVRSDCQRPRPGSGRTEEKVRQTPGRLPDPLRTQTPSRAAAASGWLKGDAAATPGRCLTWSLWSGWSCARACSLGYVVGSGPVGKLRHLFADTGARPGGRAPRGDLPSHPGLGTGGAEEPVRTRLHPRPGQGQQGAAGLRQAGPRVQEELVRPEMLAAVREETCLVGANDGVQATL